ncbi:MAG: hypothetical protein U0574_07985 [Phycisphaerales bacterium]
MPREGPSFSIGRSTGICAASGETLAPGTACMAVLVDRGDQGLERQDFSLAAWNAGQRPERWICFWKTVVQAPDAKRGIRLDDDVLEEVLDRLEGDARPERQAFRWLVALMLLRRRRLRHDGVETAGGVESWRFRRRGDAEGAAPIRVVNPRLSEEDLRALSEQLGDVVEAGA